MVEGSQELYQLVAICSTCLCVCQVHFSGRQQFYRVLLSQSPLTELPTGRAGSQYIARSSVRMVYCIKFIPWACFIFHAVQISEMRSMKPSKVKVATNTAAPSPYSQVVKLALVGFCNLHYHNSEVTHKVFLHRMVQIYLSRIRSGSIYLCASHSPTSIEKSSHFLNCNYS